MEELSYEQLDRYITNICLGTEIVTAQHEGNPSYFLLKHPTLEDLSLSSHKYSLALAEAETTGLISMAAMEKVIEDRNLFTEKDKEELVSLRSKLKGQYFLLEKTLRVPAKRDRIKATIERIKNDINNISIKKEKFLELTQERKAQEQKYLFLTWKCVLDINTHNRVWSTYDDFCAEKRLDMRKELFLRYVIFSHGIPSKIIRYIARSNLWRITYVTSLKTGESVFGTNIGRYTVDQKMLMYWSHYYQSVYEMMPADRPEDSIIEDDAALDAFMSNYSEERNRDAAAARGKKGSSGPKTAWDYGENIVFGSNPMQEDIAYSQAPATNPRNKGASVVDAAPTTKARDRFRR